jgi:hypothetical protein
MTFLTTRVAFVLILALCVRLSDAEPSAHDPQYDDRSVWPEWVTQTDFAKQSWPKARVLVWARPGETNRNVDFDDPANWLEDGKPATRGPDKDTDVVIPASETRYKLTAKQGGAVRHLTVERGASAGIWTIQVHGNMWIKEGGSFAHVRPAGPGNTFMRNDDPEPNLAANKIAFNKPPGDSTEWIGNWKIGDELDIFSGRFIVAPGSTFQPGDRSTQHIYEKGTLILLSGSTFEKRAMQYGFNEIDVEGTILAGTPERPLTKDATIGISFKAQGIGGVHNSKKGDRGLTLYQPGKIAVHSADPSTARLVFRRNTNPAKSWDFPGGVEPAEVVAMDHGYDMTLLGQVDFNGVEFRDVLKGGLALPDPDARTQWKNVTFGENFGAPDELFVRYDGPLDIRMRETGIARGLTRGKGEAED